MPILSPVFHAIFFPGFDLKSTGAADFSPLGPKKKKSGPYKPAAHQRRPRFKTRVSQVSLVTSIYQSSRIKEVGKEV